MRVSFAALRRSKGIRDTGASAAAKGVYVTESDLAGMRAAARNFGFLKHQPVHSLLSGRHQSRVKGRGLAFEELRQYLPGDDVRTIDWRVTARTGKPSSGSTRRRRTGRRCWSWTSASTCSSGRAAR